MNKKLAHQRRQTRIATLTVKECERCRETHDFPVEIILDKAANVMGLGTAKTETCDVVLTCPKTNEDIIITVSLTLDSLETLVHVQPKR